MKKLFESEKIYNEDLERYEKNTIYELTKEELKDCEDLLEEKSEVLEKLDFYYNQFLSWADEFENSTMEQKKMIVCHLIKEIRVSRGYELEIEFNISYRQFLMD